jgi:hypothetical protein
VTIDSHDASATEIVVLPRARDIGAELQLHHGTFVRVVRVHRVVTTSDALVSGVILAEPIDDQH